MSSAVPPAAGRPRLTFKVPRRRSTLSEPAGRLAYREVSAHIVPGKLGAATPTAFYPRPLGEMRQHLAHREPGAAAPATEHSRPQRASALGLRVPPSAVPVLGGYRTTP